MSGDWKPADYRDEFRARLHKVIEKRMKQKGLVSTPEDSDAHLPENAATNVVDFMSLLKKSIDTKHRTPARKAAPVKTAAAKPTKKKVASRPAAKKKAPVKTVPKRRKSA